MFSANENLMLRQHKRRIVDRIEETLPEEALDMGTTVMVMQVSCKDPGCVPLETAIIIVFPKCGEEELVPGLPESVGGSYKTKILKPMADVTEDDILDNLPPQFQGGRRTMEKVCLYARDVMFAQITQLFGDGSEDATTTDGGSLLRDRKAMALYLKACLDDYIVGGCKPPEFGEPMNDNLVAMMPQQKQESGEATTSELPSTTTEPLQTSSTTPTSIPSTGNVVIRRKTETSTQSPPSNSGSSRSTTSIRVRQPPQHERAIQQALGAQSALGSSSNSSSSMAISALFQREHAPGIRKPGCPCCNPEDPARLADSFMML